MKTLGICTSIAVFIVFLSWLFVIGLNHDPLITLFVAFSLIPGTLFTICAGGAAFCSERGITWRVGVFAIASLVIIPLGILGVFKPVGHKTYCEDEEHRKNRFSALFDWVVGPEMAHIRSMPDDKPIHCQRRH